MLSQNRMNIYLFSEELLDFTQAMENLQYVEVPMLDEDLLQPELRVGRQYEVSLQYVCQAYRL